jgi:hypothetical protein
MPEKSRARKMQEASIVESEERRIRLTVVDDKGFEYHLTPHEMVVRNILDPDVPDVFIEVPIDPRLQGSVKHAYLHTSRIARLYQHDEFSEETDNGDDTGKQKAVKGG